MNNICDPIVGIQYQAILQNLEHISDMCSDLAIYILQLSDPDVIGNEHDYIHELHHSGNQEYQAAYKEHYAKYFGALNDLPFTRDGLPKPGPEQLSFT